MYFEILKKREIKLKKKKRKHKTLTKSGPLGPAGHPLASHSCRLSLASGPHQRLLLPSPLVLPSRRHAQLARARSRVLALQPARAMAPAGSPSGPARGAPPCRSHG
jgi:hypothetical protein